MESTSIKKAALLQLGSKYVGVIVQLLLTVVLARLLTPTEFGLVATVTVFTNFFAILSDLGVSVGIVQYRDLTDDDISGLLLFSILLGVILCLIFCLLAFPISLLYSDSALIGLCLFSSISIVFATANAVPNGVLLREKRFLAISARYIVVSVISCIVAIGLAFAGLGAYALAANTVFTAVCTFAWNLKASGVKIKRAPMLAPLKRIGRYSGFQALSSIVNYFSRNLDNLLTGLVFGQATLGFYDKAYKLTTYPNTYLTGVISSILQPYLSEHQDNKEIIWDKFIRLTKLCFALGIGVVAVFLAASSEIVELMYGSQWAASVPMLQIIGVSVAFQMCTSMTGAVYQSLGATDWAFRSTLVNTAITVLAVIVGVLSKDIIVLCVCVSLAFCVNPVATYWYLVKKAFGREVAEFVGPFKRLALVAIVLWLVSATLSLLTMGMFLVSLVVKLALIAVVYIALMCLLHQMDALSPILPSGLRKKFN